jgi:hypothetical protein
MKNVRLGNRVNRIGAAKIGYLPTMTKAQRCMLSTYQNKLQKEYSVRAINIYCYYKHQKMDMKEIAKKFALKPDRVKTIYYKFAKQIKEWKDNEY